jgi:hypothetical protein
MVGCVLLHGVFDLSSAVMRCPFASQYANATITFPPLFLIGGKQ